MNNGESIEAARVHQYDKYDAIMTKGYAILSMCVLHLFCCLGADVKGTPLIWLTPQKPLVYWFGFFAEICVPTYSLCAGYAQALMDEKGKLSFRSNLVRIKKLMINYWIIVIMFSTVGIISNRGEVIPQSVPAFLKSLVLLHSYNGAWWFLNTYVILLCLSGILMIPIRKLEPTKGIMLCFAIDLIWYLLCRFDIIPDAVDIPVIGFVYKETINLIDVLPYFWIGGFLCKAKLVSKADQWLNVHVKNKRGTVLLGSLAFAFVAVNILEKAVLIGPCAVLTFLTFNLIDKPVWVEKTFAFLGKHSTNIWLTHMFFYAYTFPGLVQRAKLPVLMLLFLLFLSIATSYVVQGVQMIARFQLLKKGT